MRDWLSCLKLPFQSQSEKRLLIDIKDRPDSLWLDRFMHSEWPDYESWIRRYQYLDDDIWMSQRREALSWDNPPFFNVVVPVYNTPPGFLFECVFSLFMQSYPFWELCLVDDGSDRMDTRLMFAFLNRGRGVFNIKAKILPENAGISNATNEAIRLGRGGWVAFLDHDDVLSPEALYWMAKYILEFPDTDVLYSDRDELSEAGVRFRFLLKPDWSPETILGTIYLFHLTVWRRSFLEGFSKGGTGPLRSEFDGAQDYDLLLRASERTDRIRHVPRVLYHYRRHPGSLSMNEEVKPYGVIAARKALSQALKRRGIPAELEEIPWLWRGNYRLRFEKLPEGSWKVFTWRRGEEKTFYRTIAGALVSRAEFIIFLFEDLIPVGEDSFRELLYWFHVPEVAMVTGKVLDASGKIWHAGLVLKPDGDLLPVYRGCPESEPGYMAMTTVARNVSVPYPLCVAVRREALEKVGYADSLKGPHILLDVALRLAERGQRVVFNPFAKFVVKDPVDPWFLEDREVFRRLHEPRLSRGDPYYHPGFSLDDPIVRLR